MTQKITNMDLMIIYELLRAFSEDLVTNPSEDWELDYFDEPLVDRKGILAVLKKIEKLLPKDDLERIRKKILRRKYDSFNNEIDEEVYDKIERAFRERRTVKIGYFDMDSAKIIMREIDVYHKARKYVIAYCHLRSAIRKFRTSRIVSAKLTGKTYTIPDDFDKNRY